LWTGETRIGAAGTIAAKVRIEGKAQIGEGRAAALSDEMVTAGKVTAAPRTRPRLSPARPAGE